MILLKQGWEFHIPTHLADSLSLPDILVWLFS